MVFTIGIMGGVYRADMTVENLSPGFLAFQHAVRPLDGGFGLASIAGTAAFHLHIIHEFLH